MGISSIYAALRLCAASWCVIGLAAGCASSPERQRTIAAARPGEEVSGASTFRKGDPRNYFLQLPARVEGLRIVEGPRTDENIITDMAPAVVYGEDLFRRLRGQGSQIGPGVLLVRVVVEYTGEVIDATVERSTIDSDEFQTKMLDCIKDLDFSPWARHDNDTEFIYPLEFPLVL